MKTDKTHRQISHLLPSGLYRRLRNLTGILPFGSRARTNRNLIILPAILPSGDSAPKKQTAKKSSSSGYSIKNVRACVRNLDYKTFRIDVHFDVLNNRNNARILRIDDIVISYELKNRGDVPSIRRKHTLGSRQVNIKPLGSHRFRFNFKVEDPYAGQAGSYTLTNVRVSAKPRFGQTQNRNNSGNRVIIIQ